MDTQKGRRLLAQGAARWQAARLKPIVKKLGTHMKKKPKAKKEGFGK